MLEWLHPFFREASNQVQIRLNGVPKASMPRLYSPDWTEQIRLDNHTDLIHTLSQRWTNKVTVFFDTLVGEVSRRLRADTTVDGLVRERLEDFIAGRGRTPSALIYASVCQAVLDRRPKSSKSSLIRILQLLVWGRKWGQAGFFQDVTKAKSTSSGSDTKASKSPTTFPIPRRGNGLGQEVGPAQPID